MYEQDMNLYRQHYEDLLREAEEARAAQEALGDHRFNPALAWMGRRMVTLGKGLIKMSGDNVSNDGQNENAEQTWTYEPDINLN